MNETRASSSAAADADKDLRFIAIAPTFNNARTLRAVLDGTALHGLPIIVVDDGSTDDTRDVIRQWLADGSAETRLAIRHDVNRGKAAAMRTGFARAAELGLTHALTIDTDGQHDPRDVPSLCGAAAAAPDALVIGNRPCGNDYPFRSRIGRCVSNALVHWISGARVSDSQCGLRVYPIQIVLTLNARTSRYAYETEILVRAAWANVPIVSVPVACIYNVATGRVTHFRLLQDSAAAAWMHFRLLHRSAWPWPVRKLRPVDADEIQTGTLFERGGRWLNPMRAWRQLRVDARERERIGPSMGWGMFIGTQLPLGYKGALCLLVAKVFRLQPLIVLATSSLSTPPLGFVLWGGAIIVGHVLLHGSVPSAAEYDIRTLGVMPVIRAAALEWIIGGIVLGGALGVATWLIAAGLVRLFSTRRRLSARQSPAA